jgi:alanine racemase
MSRAATVLIDCQALRHNLKAVRKAAPSSRVLAVIKANGYGHGIVRVAHALSEADAFAVACVEEGAVLRQAGITHPVVLLEGVFDRQELAFAVGHKLEIVVHQPDQVRLLESSGAASPATVWLKVDTGMHRLGFAPSEIRRVWQRLEECAAVGSIRLMSHFANADARQDPSTAYQLGIFEEATQGLEGERSVANSGGILDLPQSHYDWVRPGIMLYGVSPFHDTFAAEHELRPSMTLSTRLIAVNHHKRGDAVGYGGRWVCPEDMPVGVAAIGYGDGYPRHADTGTPVLLKGKRVPLVGTVSMDMICLDLRSQPNAKLGDPVVLWGDGLPVEEIARHADTIGYELLCRVTQRVHVSEKA